MDRSKIVSIVIALACVAGLIALGALSSKLDPATHASCNAVLGMILWQVKPAIGGSSPPAPPTLPTMLLAIAVGSVIVSTPLALCSCGPSQGASSPARDYARAGVLLMADAVHAADAVCATIAETKKDAALAKTCADSYDVARASLLSAQSFVDGWNDADRGSYQCALGKAAAALSHGIDAAKAAGASVPPLIVDALSFAGGLSGSCS